MGIKSLLGKIKKELRVLKGKAAKNKSYTSSKTYATKEEAALHYTKSVERLFDINSWSDIEEIPAQFQLFDRSGEKKYNPDLPQINDYILIEFTGPLPINWVKICNVSIKEDSAQFTVRPSSDPLATDKKTPVTSHFFKNKSRSVFKVSLHKNTITAQEIGTDETINNRGREAGDRKLINTMIAEAGWAGFQKFQWEILTSYLCLGMDAKK
ncbi:MAG: hypothetical protein V7724_14660 [Sediminicola sp.]